MWKIRKTTVRKANRYNPEKWYKGMSIEMKNPKTVAEKIDAAANLVEQMMLSHTIRDEAHFKKAHKQAGDLLFAAQRQLEEEENHK